MKHLKATQRTIESFALHKRKAKGLEQSLSLLSQYFKQADYEASKRDAKL